MLTNVGIADVIVLAALMLALYFVRDALRRNGFDVARNAAGTPLVGRPPVRFLLLEFIELLLAGVFFIVGGAKLVGRADMVTLFRDVGIGQWFRYLTGGIEVAGAVLLVTPLFAGISALALAGVMIAATVIELVVLHRPPIAALACLSGHSLVAWARQSSRVARALRDEEVPTTWSNSVRTRWLFYHNRQHVRHVELSLPHEARRAGRRAQRM